MTPDVRHAWLQKHPSPAAARGEFHWYPAGGDRELRASVVEQTRGVDAPAVFWQLAPGRVVWAQVFAAVAPTDGRRYAGLVLSIAEDARAPAVELLQRIACPAAEPWSEAPHAAPRLRAPAGSLEIAGIARALIGGGDAVVADSHDAALPERIASVERWMPARIANAARAGVWRSGAALPSWSGDRVAGVVAAAWRDPKSRAAQAWTLLCELAAARERTVDEIAAELGGADAGGISSPSALLTDDERAALGRDPVRDFTALLHAWGRGRLDASATAATLPARLADALALRVLAQLLADRDPRAPLTEARWHALLPAARRSMLFETAIRRAGSLRALEGIHA